MELIMLGTGCASATNCYNTCFALRLGPEYFLVDAGGGNGIFRQLNGAAINCARIRHLFVTHCHTDHLLGVIWLLRKISALMLEGKYADNFTIHCHAGLARAIQTICALTLAREHGQFIGRRIEFKVVDDGDKTSFLGMGITFFDVGSDKDRQYGFSAELPAGQRLACLGDEPYNQKNRRYVENCDWLLLEAFCLYADRDIFRPYEKHHSTALEAAKVAEGLKIKNLLLYHTEDTKLSARKQLYTAEARTVFSGNVFVPDDLERIAL